MRFSEWRDGIRRDKSRRFEIHDNGTRGGGRRYTLKDTKTGKIERYRTIRDCQEAASAIRALEILGQQGLL